MKNIFKRILTLSFIVVMLTFDMHPIYALKSIKTIDINNEELKLYDVKEKEEVLVKNNEIFDFYEENYEKFNLLLEEKVREEERIAKEKRVNIKVGLVEYAKQFVGNPYVMGGNSLTNGTDCSGFVKLIYENYGIFLPRTPYEQSIFGEGVSIDNIEVGDIISYGYDGYVTHSALYIGDGMIVHAATQEQGIIISSMYMMPIVTIRRVI